MASLGYIGFKLVSTSAANVLQKTCISVTKRNSSRLSSSCVQSSSVSCSIYSRILHSRACSLLTETAERSFSEVHGRLCNVSTSFRCTSVAQGTFRRHFSTSLLNKNNGVSGSVTKNCCSAFRSSDVASRHFGTSIGGIIGNRVGVYSYLVQKCCDGNSLPYGIKSSWRKLSGGKPTLTKSKAALGSRPKLKIQKKKQAARKDDDSEGMLKTPRSSHAYMYQECLWTLQKWQVVAYATADEYSMERLRDGLMQQNLYSLVSVLDTENDPLDVLRVRTKYTDPMDEEAREIYFFEEGCVVFWNVPELERWNVLRLLKHYQENAYAENVVKCESESMDFMYTDSAKSRLFNGCAQLNSTGSTTLPRYTFSQGLALTVKLGIWEAWLDEYVDSIEFVYEDLKRHGHIRLSRKEVLKKIGNLYDLRHLINLSSDLIDTPDFFWDREDMEDIYNKMRSYFNISARTRVVNEKLNYLIEVMGLLSTHLNEDHSARLEIIIIILIAIEIMFEVLHLVKPHL